MKRQTATQFDQSLLNLYDDYAHGRVDRRTFRERASRFAVGGLTASATGSTSSADSDKADGYTRARRNAHPNPLTNS